MSLTIQQLIDRKYGLFGSDASMLDGTNPYHDSYFLYKAKRGEWDDSIPLDSDGENPLHLEIGHGLEDLVARRYSKRKKKRVRRDNRTVWSKKYLYEGKPFMGAHVDRRVVGERKILECKTANSRSKWGKNGSGIIPPNYRSQIKHYCLVLGIRKADLAVLFLPYPQSLEIHSFEFSDIELNDLLEKEYHIWDCIQRGIEPPVGHGITTNKMLREEFSGSEDEVVVSTKDISNDVTSLSNHKKMMKQLKGAEVAYVNKIIQHMGKNEVLVDHNGDEIATFKPDSKGVRKLLIKQE